MKPHKQERFWLDEWNPDELRRRAKDLDRDGLKALATDFRRRAHDLEEQKGEA